jgi:hypothetical protein
MVAIYFVDGTRTSTSNARWMMTQHLRRKLGPREHVDHKNENPRDDRIKNFQLLTPEANLAKHMRLYPTKGIERGWRHGTIYAWMVKHCKCPTCTTAERVWKTAYNTKRKLARAARGTRTRSPNVPVTHGRRAMYIRGCRCDLCRVAQRDYMRDYTRKRAIIKRAASTTVYNERVNDHKNEG